MNIIADNPYRILGVHSNASKREIVGKQGKIKAFAKTGRSLSFPIDCEKLLGPVNRDIEHVNQAVGQLALDKDKVMASLFWFMVVTSSDGYGIQELHEGYTSTAQEMFSSHHGVSSMINLAVTSLIRKDWSAAANHYIQLLENNTNFEQFVSAVADTPKSVTQQETEKMLVDALISNFSSVNWLDVLLNKSNEPIPWADKLRNSQLFTLLAPRYVDKAINQLSSLLSSVSNIPYEDAANQFKAAEKVDEESRSLLSTLKQSLGKTDVRYQKWADNVALQIVNSCIAYYNNVDLMEISEPKNLLRMLRYAYRTAEGQTAIDRCKKNLDIIKEALDQIPSQEILADVKHIHKELEEFTSHYSASIPANIDKLKNTLDLCHSFLVHIKATVGSNNEDYIAVSSEVVRVALNFIVAYVNTKIEAFNQSSGGFGTWEAQDLKITLKSLNPLFAELVGFDKSEECNKSFLRNRVTFNGFYNRFCRTSSSSYSYSQGPKRSYSSNTNSVKSNTAKTATNSKTDKFVAISAIVFIIICIIGFFVALLNQDKKESQNTQEMMVKAKAQSTDQDASSDTVAYGYDNDGNYSYDNESTSSDYTTIQYGTGDKPFADYYGGGIYDRNSRNSLKIDNGSDTDALLFLESLDGKKIRHVYIMRGESFTMTKIPGGRYIMKVMQGNSWNPDKYNGDGAPTGGFMEENSISKSEESDPFVYPSSSSQKYREYSITLYKVENGNMASENIDESELFN